jgi:hypothetical protein
MRVLDTRGGARGPALGRLRFPGEGAKGSFGSLEGTFFPICNAAVSLANARDG